jgi:hypothetical protein
MIPPWVVVAAEVVGVVEVEVENHQLSGRAQQGSRRLWKASP